MVGSGTVTSAPVLAVQTCTAWPQPAMVQSPRLSFSIMPQLAMPLVQSAAGAGRERRGEVVGEGQGAGVGFDGLAA